jgi:hypothetical protein
MGLATMGWYSHTCLLSLPMSSTCCAIMHGVMICTCFLWSYSNTMIWLTLGPRCVCSTLTASCTKGDDACDTNTFKIHTQLHNSQSHHYIGDLMRYSTAMWGECGLKVWAKGMSKWHLNQGLTSSRTALASSGIGERTLLKTIINWLKMQNYKEQAKPIIQAYISKRQLPHFCYRREEDAATVWNHSTERGMNGILIQEQVSSSSRF